MKNKDVRTLAITTVIIWGLIAILIGPTVRHALENGWHANPCGSEGEVTSVEGNKK